MNIEKIKNYNQKMLAVFSTLLIVLTSILIIFSLFFVIQEILSNQRNPENKLITAGQVEELKKQKLRQQLFSYDFPRLIDTINQIYIIPITNILLEKPEGIPQEQAGLLSIQSGLRIKTYSRKAFYGSFINLLIFENKENKFTKMCETRLIADDMSVEYFQDQILIVFKGADNDTDNDGYITLNDFKSLYIFSVQDKKLRKISQANCALESWEFISNSKDMIIRFGYDRNKDSKFDNENEPYVLMKYNFLENKLINLVPPEIDLELQKIIDNDTMISK
jgi:hypothetical protein